MSEETPLLKLLVIDDDKPHAIGVASALERIASQCDVLHSQKEAIEFLSNHPDVYDVVITDLMLEEPDSGLQILKTVREQSDQSEVIVMTGHGSVALAVEAMRQGAFNYLQKPLDLGQLRTVVSKAGEGSRLRRENRALSERLDEKYGFDGVVGTSPQIRSVIERLRRIAPTDATVLIQGDTGTGKELFAQSIHQNSPRKNKPFVALNCAALSENILESELFGHVKGAFTDASSDRLGKFEYANGGTLFLDEVGDMPMLTQIKLLRVLENGEITRVGSNESRKVNVRLLSATNRNLEQAVQQGTFRRDLYHRLKVITITIPPLKERTGDIPILLDYFIRFFSKKNHKSIKGATPSARKRILSYDWPGNVRQLRNAAESMVVVDIDHRIDLDDLPEELLEPEDLKKLAASFSSSDSPLENSMQHGIEEIPDSLSALVGHTLEDVERLFIGETLQASGGNREEAAKKLGIGERTLYRKIKEYGLS